MYYYVTGVTRERGRGIFEGPLSEAEANRRLSDKRLLHAKVFESNHRDRSAAASEYRASRVQAGQDYDSVLERMKSSPEKGKMRDSIDHFESNDEVF